MAHTTRVTHTSMDLLRRLWSGQTTEQDIQEIRESCLVTTATHGTVGFLFGGFMGMFMASMSTNPHALLSTPESNLHTTSAQVKTVFKDLIKGTWSSAKGFGKVATIYSAAECVVEGYRGKHDLGNGLVAGCFTGGFLARAGGPSSALMGCAGFAAFSVAIEAFMGRQSADGHFDNVQ